MIMGMIDCVVSVGVDWCGRRGTMVLVCMRVCVCVMLYGMG